MHLFGIILLATWVLALATTLLNLALLPHLRGAAGPAALPDDAPLVSIIIPARNEERAIEETVRRMLDQTWPSLELIVVDDRSEDGTAAILARLAATDPRLHLIDGEEPPAGWLGKPWALDRGSRAAHGEMLLFVDADVHYERQAVAAAVAYLESSNAALVTLLPNLEMSGFWEHVAMPQLAMAAFVVLPTWLANHTTTVALAIGGGPGNLVRRADFDAVGGYEALRDAVVDDIGMVRLLRSHGRRTKVVRAAELVSLRMYHGGREIVEGFTKNVFAAFGRSYGITALALAGFAALHLAPYLLALTGNPFAIAAVVLITIVRLLLLLPLGYGFLNALLMHPVMTLFWAWIFLRSMWKTGVRGEMQWRGRKYDDRWTRFGAKR